MKKAYILIALVLLFSAVNPSAHAIGGVEVTGSAVMDQTVFGQITLIGADTMGLAGPIKEAAAAASYNDPIKWVIDGVSQWLLVQKLQWGTALSIAANGAKYLKDGRILLNGELSDFLTAFYHWIWDADGGPNISQYADVIPSDEAHVVVTDAMKQYLHYPDAPYGNIALGQGMVGYKSDYTEYTFRVEGNRYASCLLQSNNPGNYVYLIISDTNLSIEYYENGSFKRYYSLNSTNAKNGQVFYFREITVSTELDPMGLSVSSWPDSFGSTNAADLAYIIYGGGLQIGDDTILGNPDALGGLTGDRDTNVLAPPDLFDWSNPDFNIPGDGEANIDINNYLDALQKGILEGEGNADIQITQEDGTTIDQTESFTYDQTQDISIEQTATNTIDQPITSVAPVTEVSGLAPFTMDLRNYFPFCIPWDIYNMITILVADPEAPKIDYPFVIPNIVDYTIELDFARFDSVAQVLRTMELLAAAVGLAFVTKRLIQGGD